MNPFEKIIQDLKEKEAAASLHGSVEALQKSFEALGEAARQVDVVPLVEALTKAERDASFRGVVTKAGRRFWRGVQLLTADDAKRFLRKEKE